MERQTKRDKSELDAIEALQSFYGTKPFQAVKLKPFYSQHPEHKPIIKDMKLSGLCKKYPLLLKLTHGKQAADHMVTLLMDRAVPGKPNAMKITTIRGPQPDDLTCVTPFVTINGQEDHVVKAVQLAIKYVERIVTGLKSSSVKFTSDNKANVEFNFLTGNNCGPLKWATNPFHTKKFRSRCIYLLGGPLVCTACNCVFDNIDELQQHNEDEKDHTCERSPDTEQEHSIMFFSRNELHASACLRDCHQYMNGEWKEVPFRHPDSRYFDKKFVEDARKVISEHGGNITKEDSKNGEIKYEALGKDRLDAIFLSLTRSLSSNLRSCIEKNDEDGANEIMREADKEIDASTTAGFIPIAEREGALQLQRCFSGDWGILECDDSSLRLFVLLSVNYIRRTIVEVYQEQLKDSKSKLRTDLKQSATKLKDELMFQGVNEFTKGEEFKKYFKIVSAMSAKLSKLPRARRENKQHFEQSVEGLQGDLKGLYNDAKSVHEKFKRFMTQLNDLYFSKKWHSEALEPKNIFRSIEKIGVEGWGHNGGKTSWDASVLTNILCGRVEICGDTAAEFSKNIIAAFNTLMFCDEDIFDISQAAAAADPSIALKKKEMRDKLDLIVIVEVKNRNGDVLSDVWRNTQITFYFKEDTQRHLCEIQIVSKTVFAMLQEERLAEVFAKSRKASEIMEALGILEDDGCPRLTSDEELQNFILDEELIEEERQKWLAELEELESFGELRDEDEGWPEGVRGYGIVESEGSMFDGSDFNSSFQSERFFNPAKSQSDYFEDTDSLSSDRQRHLSSRSLDATAEPFQMEAAGGGGTIIDPSNVSHRSTSDDDLPDQMEDWTADHVASWLLHFAGMNEAYVNVLYAKGLTGRGLVHVQMEDFEVEQCPKWMSRRLVHEVAQYNYNATKAKVEVDPRHSSNDVAGGDGGGASRRHEPVRATALAAARDDSKTARDDSKTAVAEKETQLRAVLATLPVGGLDEVDACVQTLADSAKGDPAAAAPEPAHPGSAYFESDFRAAVAALVAAEAALGAAEAELLAVAPPSPPVAPPSPRDIKSQIQAIVASIQASGTDGGGKTGGSFGYVFFSDNFRHSNGTVGTIAIKTPKNEDGRKPLEKEVDILKLIYNLKVDGENTVPQPPTATGIPKLFYVWPDMVVMQRYEDSLSSQLSKPHFGLTQRDAIVIARDICGALHWLHSEGGGGIAHCDVKPENIMLDADSSFGQRRAILIDFGSAKKNDVQQATQSTVEYLAPNMRYPDVSPPHHFPHTLKDLMGADCYAVGLVAWEMLFRLLRPATSKRMYSQLHWTKRKDSDLIYEEDLVPSKTDGDCVQLLKECVNLCCTTRQEDALVRVGALVQESETVVAVREAGRAGVGGGLDDQGTPGTW